MDLIKKRLDNLKRGYATTMWGVIVLRIGERYIVGETINYRDRGVSYDEAVEAIYYYKLEAKIT